jgi:hypothetical protein
VDSVRTQPPDHQCRIIFIWRRKAGSSPEFQSRVYTRQRHAQCRTSVSSLSAKRKRRPALRQRDLVVQPFNISSTEIRCRRGFRRASSRVSGPVSPQSGQTNKATLPCNSDRWTATTSNGRWQLGHSSGILKLLIAPPVPARCNVLRLAPAIRRGASPLFQGTPSGRQVRLHTDGCDRMRGVRTFGCQGRRGRGFSVPAGLPFGNADKCYRSSWFAPRTGGSVTERSVTGLCLCWDGDETSVPQCTEECCSILLSSLKFHT